MAKKKNTLLGTGADWARQFDEWEKDRTQRVETSKAMDAKGDMRPLAGRVMPTYTNEKFNAKKGSLDGGSTKWRTEAVKGLSSKKYGRKYGDRLNKLMDEAGVPKHERYQFARWMDSQEHQKLNPDEYPKVEAPKKNSPDFGTKKAPKVSDFSPVGTAEKNESLLDKIVGGAKKGYSEFDRFVNNINNSATFGLFEGREQEYMKEIAERTGDDTLSKLVESRYGNEDRGTAGKVADVASKGLGMMTTGAGIARGLQALGLGTKAGASVGANAVRMAGQGAVAGGGDQAIRSTVDQTINKELERNQDRTWRDEAEDIAMGTAFGAVLDPLLTVAPQAIREGARSLRGVTDEAVRSNDVIKQLAEMTADNRGARTNAMDALEALRGARPDPNSTFMNAIDPNYNVKLPNSPEPEAQMVSEDEMYSMLGRSLAEEQNARMFPSSFDEVPATTTPKVDTSKIDKQIAQIDKKLQKSPLDMTLRNQRMQLEAQKQLDMALNQAPVEAPQTNRNIDSNTTTRLESSDSLPQNANLSTSVATELPVAQPVTQQPPTVRTSTYSEELPDFVDNSVTTKKDERSLGQKAKDTADNIYASTVDELQPIRRAEEQALKADARGVIERNKPTSLIQRLKGADGIENVKTKDSITKSLQVVGKGSHSRSAHKVEEVWSDFASRIEKETDTSIDDVIKYAFARHGLKLLDDSEAGFYTTMDDILAENPSLTDDELGEIMMDYKNYQLPEGAEREVLEKTVAQLGQNPKLTEYYKEFQQLQSKKLDDMYESGLINKQAYDTMKANDTYISMARNFHNDDSITGMGGGRQARTPIEGMKSGSEAKIKNSFQEAIRQTYVTEFNIQKNNALKPIEKYAQIPNSGFRKVAPTEDLRGLNTVEIYKNGRKIMYEVPEPVANYVKNFNVNSDPDVIANSLQKLADIQRKLTTQYSPAFIMKSALREPVQSIIVSRTNKGWVDGMRNLGLGYVDAFVGPELERATASLPKSLQFKSYKPTFDAFGGNQFQYMDMADKELKQSAKELMETGTINNSKNIKVVSWYPRFLSYMGEKVESAPRLGEFRSAKRRGYDDLDAFFEATDLTNFKRSGTLTGEANKYMPYLNATIQGNDRVLRAFKEAPVKTIARGATGLSSIAGLAYMARFHDNVSDEQRNELQNLQDYQKNTNMFIPNFWDKNDDTIYAIPKPFAVGQMFMNPVERVLDDYHNQLASDPSAKETAGKIMGDVARSFMPPTGVALVTPLLENAFNKDSFTGMPIEQDEELPVGEREAYGQSVITKWIADAMNFASFSEEGWVSPADVDNLVKSTIGSEGTRALQATDQYLSDVPPVAGPNTFERVLGQFTLDPTTSGRGYKEMEKLKKDEDISSIIQSITGDPTDTSVRNLNDAQRATFDGQTNYYNMFDQYADMNKEINAIRKDPDLNGDAKRRRIEYLRKQQDELYSQTVDYFNRLNR